MHGEHVRVEFHAPELVHEAPFHHVVDAPQGALEPLPVLERLLPAHRVPLALELLGLRRANASRALENLNTPLCLFLDAEFVLILIFHVQPLPSRDLPDAAGILTAQDVICCGIGDQARRDAAWKRKGRTRKSDAAMRSYCDLPDARLPSPPLRPLRRSCPT